MEVHELNYYKEFNCLMGECPSTCCRGWQITVDDETYKKYLLETGSDGRRLRAGIDKEDDQVVIKKHKGTCPFFTKDKRCGIQLTKGKEYMPDVCIVFPRFRSNYGFFAEELYFLSCPETVRLFLEHIDDFCFITVEKEVEYKPWVTNDDEEYLHDLLNIRKEILTLVSKKEYSIERINYILKEYAKALQLSYANYSERPSLSFYENKAGEYYIDAYLADKLVTGGLYHTLLKKASPFLYYLFKLYFKNFDKLTPKEAETHAKKLIEKMYEACPEVRNILRAFYKYHYISEFLFAYEDYSFLKNTYMAIIHNHFLELFLALYYMDKGSLNLDEIAEVILAYERRAEHNDTVTYALYSIIEEEVIKTQIEQG